MFDRDGRRYIRTFFTSPTAVDADDSAEMLHKAAQLRGLQAPDVWVPDNEDATAPSMRDEGVENLIDVLAEHGTAFPGEIHPRVVWHRDDPGTRRRGYEHMNRLADADAIAHIDGFVIPEVGHIDDWKKADEFITIIEHDHGLPEGSIRMSVIVESGQAELALSELTGEMGKPTNNLQRLFLLVDGEVDYTKDMKGMTPSGELPPWPELRHNTSRAASAVDLVAVDGPFDDIRNVEGYRRRITENYGKGMLGIWSLTPTQVEVANTQAFPPEIGSYLLTTDNDEVELAAEDGVHVYEGGAVTVEDLGNEQYRLSVGGQELKLASEELVEEINERLAYIPSLDDIVDSMEQFEEAKAAGRGAISLRRDATVRIDGVEIDIASDRMWDEATYQAAQTPIQLFQEVWEARADQHEDIQEMYGETVVERALQVG